jgi:hypothetical protein
LFKLDHPVKAIRLRFAAGSRTASSYSSRLKATTHKLPFACACSRLPILNDLSIHLVSKMIAQTASATSKNEAAICSGPILGA